MKAHTVVVLVGIFLVAILLAGCLSFSVGVDVGSFEPPGINFTSQYREYISLDYTFYTSDYEDHERDVKIAGEVTNTGRRIVSYLQVLAKFYDDDGNVVKTEKEELLDRRNLFPKETVYFNFTADDVPSSWDGETVKLLIYRIKVLAD